MTQFFKNNFNEDRWRKAALKNAFSLLGKQRFEQAAAFFLLAGSLKDAIEVQCNIHALTSKQIPRRGLLVLSLKVKPLHQISEEASYSVVFE